MRRNPVATVDRRQFLADGGLVVGTILPGQLTSFDRYGNLRGALGHPLGASGARLVTTAFHQLGRAGRGRALCTMCIGVGQGIALALESI